MYSIKKEVELYKEWCNTQGLKPYEGKNLLAYFKQVAGSL